MSLNEVVKKWYLRDTLLARNELWLDDSFLFQFWFRCLNGTLNLEIKSDELVATYAST